MLPSDNERGKYANMSDALPSVSPSLVHWTLPARSPITQLIMTRPPSGTKESCGVVLKNCCFPASLQSTATAEKWMEY